MGYAILRTQKLKSPVAVHRSMKHAFRTQDTPNADRSRTPENSHIGADSVASGMSAFREALPDQVRKNAVLCVEYLITASPESMHAKDRAGQDAYFADALAWLQERHGAENVVYAGIHRDESTPHMYAYVVPKDPDTGRLNCRRFLGGAKALSEMQTDFAKRVGQLHGLERGIEGSKAKHQRVSQHYAQIQRVPVAPKIQPDQVRPQVLEKKWFGLVRIEETPEAVAERLAAQVAAAVQPVAEMAATNRQDRRRADEMKKTAQTLGKRLEAVQGRLQGFEDAFGGLTPTQQRGLAAEAAVLRRKNEVEAEKQRRVDALPGLVRKRAGAVFVFARRALDAIKEAAGHWRLVDWARVGKEATQEAVRDHGQAPADVARALLQHSPEHADKTPQDVVKIVAEVEAKYPTPEGQRPQRRDRGPSLGR